MQDVLTKEVVVGGIAVRVCGFEDDGYFLSLDGQIIHESFFLRALRMLKRPDPVILDVGANIGLTVAIAGNALPGSRIVAVEPTKRAFHCLQKTIEANGLKNVMAINACCGEVRKTVYINQVAEFLAWSQTLQEQSGVATAIDMLTVDDIVSSQRLPRVDFIKIDVEGSEPDVLHGAQDTLEKFDPITFMEVNTVALTCYRGYSPRALLDEVVGRFEHFFIDDLAGGLTKVSNEQEIRSFLFRNMTSRGFVDDIIFHRPQCTDSRR